LSKRWLPDARLSNRLANRLANRWASRWAPIFFLLPAGVLEMVINRLAVPLLRPARGAPPAWHTALDYGGLFLFYFASLLGVIVAGLRAWQALRAPAPRRAGELATAAALAALAAASAWVILVAPSEGLTFAIEACLAAVVLAVCGRGLGQLLGGLRRRRPAAGLAVDDGDLIAGAGAAPAEPRDPRDPRERGDLGVAIGVVILAAPLLVHFAAVVGARFLWPDGSYDGAGAVIAQAGGLSLAIAGLASPYCLAPRPFVRSVTRLLPILIAITVAILAAMLLRRDYLGAAAAVKLALGVELSTTSADPQLTLYLLALATLSWTLTSCAIARTAPRRLVALGLAFLVLGGYGFQWPLHYLLLAIGLVTVIDTASTVRAAEELVPGVGPAVDDAVWGRYLGAVSATLRRRCSSLHTLTTRGSDTSTSSVLVGEADGRALRARIDRDGGSVIGMDIVIGRDLDLGRGTAASLVVVCDEPYLADDAPLAEPALESGDAAFDRRFRSRGSQAQLAALFSADLRGRALGLLDGWVALAHGHCLRYRSYPGRGAAVDPLIPLADLAQGQLPGGAAERMMVMLELLLELAARGEVASTSDLTTLATGAAAGADLEKASSGDDP
jgi:hypothetical protein